MTKNVNVLPQGVTRRLLGRAVTRLLNGDHAEFKRLALLAEDLHDKDIHLYATIDEILYAKKEIDDYAPKR